MEAVNGFKVYRMNDCDWYLGRTPEEAIAAQAEDVGCTLELMREEGYVEEGGPTELAEADLDGLSFFDEDGEVPVTRTFRAQLAFQPPTKPQMFASTEY